jgi:hypothetical protein
MEDQLLISKSMIFNNIKENIIQPINIDVSIGNDIKRKDNLVGNDINVKSKMSTQKMNTALSRPKSNNINKDFGDIWIPPLSLQKTLSNDNNTYNSNSETNLNFLSQQQPQINYSDINVSQSLQIINKELDMLTGRINNNISCTHNYNKEHNFGCNYYDASSFLRKSNDQYKQFSYDSLDKNKFFDYSYIQPPPRLRDLLTSGHTTNQRYNDYYTIPNSNNTNYSSSGVIWGVNKDNQLVILTAKHCVEFDTNAYYEVFFVDGNFYQVDNIYTSNIKDFAFLAIDLDKISTNTLNTLKTIKYDYNVEYECGEKIYVLGKHIQKGLLMYNGEIQSSDFINKLGKIEPSFYTLITNFSVVQGTSGGGIYNENGLLLGICSEGNTETTVFVPIYVIIDAYNEYF